MCHAVICIDYEILKIKQEVGWRVTNVIKDTKRHWWTVEERLIDSTSDWLLCRSYIRFLWQSVLLSLLIPARTSQPRRCPFQQIPTHHPKSSLVQQFGELFLVSSTLVEIPPFLVGCFNGVSSLKLAFCSLTVAILWHKQFICGVK